MKREGIKGRGAGFNPPNRFEKLHLEPLDSDAEPEEERTPTVFYKDLSRSILAKNESPDVGFTYSINPYRGCEHGCIYCYARPAHEYLGFSAGLDFETKIMVKEDAPQLLSKALERKTWQPQMICLSGDTDCYQPVERRLELTRKCLEVFLKHRNPVGIITKNSLITRDMDILIELNRFNLVSVIITVTSLDGDLVRVMEPRTSTPVKRLETIRVLSSQNIPVTVFMAPVIPGLTDEELPSVLREGAASGARFAGYTLLRLPGPVKDLFLDWLQRQFPNRAEKIIARIRDIRGGKLNDPRWGTRMKGEGEYAKTVRDLFQLHCRKYGLNRERLQLSTDHFRAATETGATMNLFQDPV